MPRIRPAGLAVLLALLVLVPAPADAGGGARGKQRGAKASKASSSAERSRAPRTRPTSRRALRRRTNEASALRRAVRARKAPQRGRRPVDDAATARMRRTLRRPDHRAGIRQLTGKDLRVGQKEFPSPLPADPFVDVLPDGRVHVYGTFDTYLEFASLDDMLRGGASQMKRIETDEGLGPGASWDNMVHRWPDGKEVLYGGVMSPTGRRKEARWPADNWTRRIFGFTRGEDGTWIRHRKPLFGPIRARQKPTMIGHTYGHHFKTLQRQVDGRQVEETWIFHEEIVSENPMRTELYARRMIDPLTASDHKIKLLGVDIDGTPTLGKRENASEFLIEGPRPFEVDIDGERFHFLSFSAGDFNSDNYDLNFAWRKNDPIGAYTPYLDRSAAEPKLRGFAEGIKKRYQLSWVGRAHVIRDDRGDHWAVFHGVDKRIRPEVDYTRQSDDLGAFHRNLYAVPLRFSKGADGTPEIEVLDEPRP